MPPKKTVTMVDSSDGVEGTVTKRRNLDADKSTTGGTLTLTTPQRPTTRNLQTTSRVKYSMSSSKINSSSTTMMNGSTRRTTSRNIHKQRPTVDIFRRCRRIPKEQLENQILLPTTTEPETSHTTIHKTMRLSKNQQEVFIGRLRSNTTSGKLGFRTQRKHS